MRTPRGVTDRSGGGCQVDKTNIEEVACFSDAFIHLFVLNWLFFIEGGEIEKLSEKLEENFFFQISEFFFFKIALLFSQKAFSLIYCTLWVLPRRHSCSHFRVEST